MSISGTSGLTFPDATTMVTGAQAVKAWVNFNGTGTVAIRAAYNVSSITDNGAGRYTANFTTAMPDVNYAAVFSGNANSDSFSGDRQYALVRSRATSSVQLQVINEGGAEADASYIGAAIFR
jgi:hypothetical protein